MRLGSVCRSISLVPYGAYKFRFATDEIIQTVIRKHLLNILLKRRNLMLYTIIVILFILWLLGFVGSSVNSSIPRTGGWIHTLIVIAVILIILRVLGIA
jgi:hypothetical protein